MFPESRTHSRVKFVGRYFVLGIACTLRIHEVRLEAEEGVRVRAGGGRLDPEDVNGSTGIRCNLLEHIELYI